MRAVSFIDKTTAVSESDAPGSVGLGGFRAVMVGEGEDVWGVGVVVAGGEPARLCGSKLEMDFGAGVNVSGADSFLVERTKGWSEGYVVEAVAIDVISLAPDPSTARDQRLTEELLK